jgi:small-conductance mechanosensitive channel
VSDAGVLIRMAAFIAGALLLVQILKMGLTSRLLAQHPLASPIVRRCRAPAFVTAAFVGALGGLPARATLNGYPAQPVRHGLALALTISFTWLIVQVAYAATDVMLTRLSEIQGARNRRARRLRTQIMVLRRTLAVLIVVIAVGAMLYTFPLVRPFSTSLLASAGIAGIIAGVAAQSTLSNVFAGLQLVFSDALRIDDVLVVNGEWGRIEELTLTVVVLRLWDERRLVLPVSYFAHTPFENWTRHSSRVIGHVILNLDWSIPVAELRAELHDILREHPLWDQRDWVLQVIDVLPNGLVQVRALMSAADAPSAWDLKCDVRERLVEWVRENHPDALPRFRADISEHGGGHADQE